MFCFIIKNVCSHTRMHRLSLQAGKMQPSFISLNTNLWGRLFLRELKIWKGSVTCPRPPRQSSESSEPEPMSSECVAMCIVFCVLPRPCFVSGSCCGLRGSFCLKNGGWEGEERGCVLNSCFQLKCFYSVWSNFKLQRNSFSVCVCARACVHGAGDCTCGLCTEPHAQTFSSF